MNIKYKTSCPKGLLNYLITSGTKEVIVSINNSTSKLSNLNDVTIQTQLLVEQNIKCLSLFTVILASRWSFIQKK